jgi:uncharacterized protein
MMKLQQLLKEKREDILTVAAQHGAFNIRVFRSVSRGEETEDSDIDLLIDYDLAKIPAWFPGGLLMDLQDLLVGEASSKKLNSLLARELARNPSVWHVV